MEKYPQVTVNEFVDEVVDIMENYAYEDYYSIFGILVNDETSTDKELRDYLIGNGSSPYLVDELIQLRNYFLDFRYSQKIWTNK